MKVKILFPQIVFESKEIEVTEEQAKDLIEYQIDRTQFIWDNMDDSEKSWSTGKETIEHLFDTMKLITRVKE